MKIIIILYNYKYYVPNFEKNSLYLVKVLDRSLKLLVFIFSAVILNKIQQADEGKKVENKINTWHLFKRPLMRLLSFNCMFIWFTSSMVFYGLALNAGSLSGFSFFFFFLIKTKFIILSLVCIFYKNKCLFNDC